MPTYIFESIDQKGTLRQGEIEALNKNAVLEFLQREKLTAISIVEKGAVSKAFKISLAFLQRIKPLEKIILTRHLAAVIKAGLNLLESISILIEDTRNPTMKRILETAKFNLEKGQSLSTTFAYYSQYFSPLFVGLIKAGEVSGNLERNLNLLSNQMLREYDLRKKILGAMLYPMILLGVSFVVIIFLLTFLLPRLGQIFVQSGVKLPLLTRIILLVSGILSNHAYLTFFFLIILFIFLIYFLRSTRGKILLIRFFSKIPIFNNLIQKIALVRITQSLYSILSSGLPVLEALDLTADSVGSEYYKETILKIKEEIRRGGSLSKSLERYPNFFPRLLVSMVTFGERTGTLESVFLSTSQFYDEEIDRTLKDLVTLLEPILLLAMGFIVGSIALSILLPIYQLVGTLR